MRQFIKFAIGTVAFFGCFQAASSALALTYQFTWTGGGGFSATGDFTFNDVNGDGFARSQPTLANEFTAFNITFKDSSNVTLATYDLNQLQSFPNPGFNFNYDIANNAVLQSGLPGDLDGFALGSANTGGYLLSTNGGAGITFGNSDFSISDFGGNFAATPVPFEFSPGLSLGILGAGLALKKGQKMLKTKKTLIPQLEREQS